VEVDRHGPAARHRAPRIAEQQRRQFVRATAQRLCGGGSAVHDAVRRQHAQAGARPQAVDGCKQIASLLQRVGIAEAARNADASPVVGEHIETSLVVHRHDGAPASLPG